MAKNPHKPPHFDFSQYLPYLINRVGSVLVVDFTQSALAHRNLSIAMWRVLAVLSNDGGQRQIDLAGKTSIDVSTLSRVVTRLHLAENPSGNSTPITSVATCTSRPCAM